MLFLLNDLFHQLSQYETVVFHTIGPTRKMLCSESCTEMGNLFFYIIEPVTNIGCLFKIKNSCESIIMYCFGKLFVFNWLGLFQLVSYEKTSNWKISKMVLYVQVNSQLISNVCTDALSAEKVIGLTVICCLSDTVSCHCLFPFIHINYLLLL